MLNKKQLELHYLRRFREIFPDFPAGEVIQTEEPDFLVNAIGIELTRFFVKAPDERRPLQEQEQLRSQVILQSKTLFEKDYGVPLWVSVHFAKWSQLRKNQISELAENLTEIVERNFPNPGESSIEVFTGDNQDYFPKEFASVSVKRPSSLTEGYWSSPDIGFPPKLTSSDVQVELSKKNDRHNTYLQKCEAVWLIIVIDGHAISSFVDNIPEKTRQHGYDFQFNRVFLFRNFEGEIIELRKADS